MDRVLKFAFCPEGGPWPGGVPFIMGTTIEGRTLVEVTERNTAVRPGLNIWYVQEDNWEDF